MKKTFILSAMLFLLGISGLTLTSCGGDDEVTISESELVGTWVLYNNTESAIFSFKSNKQYNVIFGSDIYSGQWSLNGNTVHGKTSNMEEYIKFTEYKQGKGKVQYSNSNGIKYNFIIEKSSNDELIK